MFHLLNLHNIKYTYTKTIIPSDNSISVDGLTYIYVHVLQQTQSVMAQLGIRFMSVN